MLRRAPARLGRTTSRLKEGGEKSGLSLVKEGIWRVWKAIQAKTGA
ncbi:MAG: hypothetical protein QW638_07860 [Candidatus Bathyarchaeia archaeon]